MKERREVTDSQKTAMELLEECLLAEPGIENRVKAIRNMTGQEQDNAAHQALAAIWSAL